MRNSISILLMALALTACDPNSGPPASGAAFKTFEEYQRERAIREAALRGQPQTVLPPERIAAADKDTETLVSDASTAIATAPTTEPEPVQTVDENIIAAQVDEAEQLPVLTEEQQAARVGISDEQDFGAVSDRESIESDAERIANNRQQYIVIEPTDLPSRPGNLGPSIVDFALATNNPVGQPLYSRVTLLSNSRFNRNCAKYSSSDLAQQDFLSKGGPQRDRKGLDPDGDGFACYWDPSPFRAARRAVTDN